VLVLVFEPENEYENENEYEMIRRQAGGPHHKD
jgi:hypothetical protein